MIDGIAVGMIRVAKSSWGVSSGLRGTLRGLQPESSVSVTLPIVTRTELWAISQLSGPGGVDRLYPLLRGMFAVPEGQGTIRKSHGDS